jgi:hypothetical protein
MNRSRRASLTIMVSAVLMFTLATVAHAAVLSHWYSDGTTIGKWSSSPQLYYSKLSSSSSFAFASGLQYGTNLWNNALGTSVTVSSLNSSAPIKFYGGTKAQLDALNIFSPVSTTTLGLTSYTSTYAETHLVSGMTVTCRTHTAINGYLVDRTDMNQNNYYKTASHEIGHTMGWRGHPSSDQPTWVMQQGRLENLTLNVLEKYHLRQIYQLY